MLSTQVALGLANSTNNAVPPERAGRGADLMGLEKALRQLPGVMPIAGADDLIAAYYLLRDMSGHTAQLSTAAPSPAVIPAVKFFGRTLTLADFKGLAAAGDFATRRLTREGVRWLILLYHSGAFKRYAGVKGRPGRPAAALCAFAAANH